MDERCEGAGPRNTADDGVVAHFIRDPVLSSCYHAYTHRQAERKKERNRERREERKKERNKGRKYAEKLDKASLSTVCSHRRMVTDNQKAACTLTTSRRSKN